MQQTLVGIGKIKPFARTRHRHVHEAALFLDTVEIACRIIVREQAFFETTHEYRLELQPLGGVHSHQLQRIFIRAGFVFTRFEARMGEKADERRIVAFIFILKLRRRVHQLSQIFQPVRAFALSHIMRTQAAFLDAFLSKFL